jgi:hypothetical protein
LISKSIKICSILILFVTLIFLLLRKRHWFKI